MKQLILLLLIISITIISWSSCAKNTIIHVNSVYTQSYSTINLTILEPSLKPSVTNKHVNEEFGVTSNHTVHKNHNFFELAIIFNEKLQQFMSFFTDLSDTVEDIASSVFSPVSASTTNNTPSNNSLAPIQKCNTNS